MRALSMTPRDASVGTPRLGLTGGISSAAVAALTPRFFAAREAQAGRAPKPQHATTGLKGVVAQPSLVCTQDCHLTARFTCRVWAYANAVACPSLKGS